MKTRIAEVGIEPQKEKQLLQGEAWEKEKQRQNKQQNQQTMKSGKAEVGTQSAKRETAAKRRSMGKAEAPEKREAEAEQAYNQ